MKKEDSLQYRETEKVYRQYLNLAPKERARIYNRIKVEFESAEIKVVAYSITGEPLTQNQFIAEINEAIAEGDRGEIVSNEDYLKERAKWVPDTK
jgi:hypothetical protein